MWIGSSKHKKTKILGFHGIKILGAHLSYNAIKNNDANFFSKIRKMKTKLNLWQTRDLTPFGKSVLAKTLGASQSIYTASLMTVPDGVTRAAQSLLFSFLWKNKKGPSSLKSVPCRLLEHIIYRSIMIHLNSFDILVDAQHGFRPGRSCET